MISVLCANDDSIYKTLPDLDVWDQHRDAYNFEGSNPVITHAPCAQWSRMKAFAKVNQREKDLAFFCLEKVQRNGGIFEHPAGSSFFKTAGITNIYSVDQFWWGFPARKRTYLYFHDCRPLAYPLSFDAIEYCVGRNRTKNLPEMDKTRRSETTLKMAIWFIACINETLAKT